MEWISVKEKMPNVIWTEHEDGKKYFSPQTVLVHAILHLKSGEQHATICVAEYDNSGIPEEWRTVLDYYDDEAPWGGLDYHSVILQEVTHWMPLPKTPHAVD